MAQIFDDNSYSIGRTPLIRLNRIPDGAPATLLGKVEGRNPSYSVKCRIGASMIWDAEERGILKPGVELIEPTSGNTGIALAYVAAARGYRLTLTMPENFSVERRRVLRLLGAKLELTPAEDGLKCQQCNRVYPIRDDIPVMLVEEAKVEESKVDDPGGDGEATG